MNYQKIYNQLIEHRQINKISKKECYCENHHIVPKSMGGTNNSDNMVMLTAREHFIAHWLLFRIHKNSSMAYAVKSMKNSNKSNIQSQNKYLNSIGYEEVRRFCVNLFRASKKGKKESIETRLKKSIALKGRPPSVETINARKNMEMTKEYIEKLSKAKIDKAILTFNHKNGDIFIGNMFEFRTKYSLCRKYVGEICSGRRKSFKGWTEISRKKDIDNSEYI